MLYTLYIMTKRWVGSLLKKYGLFIVNDLESVFVIELFIFWINIVYKLRKKLKIIRLKILFYQK